MRAAVNRPVVVVIGSGDVGSAIAVVLQRNGFAVVICDVVDAAWSRRGMSFTDAWYVGTAELDRECSVFCSNIKSIATVLERNMLIAATTWSWPAVAQSLRAIAVVDARMRKHDRGADLRARVLPGVVSIGIGPGFIAGTNVDLAIESSRGESLGEVVTRGHTLPLSGEPKKLGHAGRERFVYAPTAGRFATARRIGDRVAAGETIGALNNTEIRAPIKGVLRGLAANGARVAEKGKIVEVDPRGDPSLCFGLGERPLAIANGLLAALIGVDPLIAFVDSPAKRSEAQPVAP